MVVCVVGVSHAVSAASHVMIDAARWRREAVFMQAAAMSGLDSYALALIHSACPRAYQSMDMHFLCTSLPQGAAHTLSTEVSLAVFQQGSGRALVRS